MHKMSNFEQESHCTLTGNDEGASWKHLSSNLPTVTLSSSLSDSGFSQSDSGPLVVAPALTSQPNTCSSIGQPSSASKMLIMSTSSCSSSPITEPGVHFVNDQNPLLDSLTKSSLLNLDSFSLSSPEASSGQTRASGKKSQISAFLDDASLPATNPENILLSPNRDTFSDIKSVSSSQRTSYHAEPFLQPPPSSSVSTSSTGLLTLPSLHHTESLQEDSSSPSLKIQALGSITLENAAPSLDQVNLGQHSVLSSCSGGGGGSIYSKVLDSESSSLQCLNEISVLKEPIPLKVLPLPSLSSSSSSSIPLRVLLPTSPQQLQPHHHHQPQAQSIQYFPETQVITTQPMMTAFSTNQIMQDQQKRAPPILIPSASQQACISWQQQKQHVYLRNKNELKLDNGETKRERNPKIELINCYKCAECGFLGLSSSAVQEHLLLEHVKEDGADAGDENGNKWVSIAIQQGIQMLCPFCDNKFNAEGPRSFKTHVIDDHGVNEEEAHGYWLVGFKNRKAATIEYLKKKRDQEREEEKKRLQREVLEAYVDPDGHLRVRAVDIKDSLRSVTVDVSAQEYVDAVKVSRKIQQSSKKTKTSNSFHENEMTPIANQKLLLAKLVGRSCKPTRSSEVGSILKNSKSKDPEQVMILQSNEDTESGQTGHQGKKEIKKIRNAGRPKGSKSIGFSKLKRLNSTIRLCDEGTGTLCSQPNCGIRMRNQDKLEYHERTHLEEPKEKEGDVRSSSFVCPECKDKFRQWSDLSLHLWKQHQLNMELLACEECSSFKAYSLAKLQSHRLTHVEERLFLCDQCPKNFKTSRNLSHHKLKKHSNDKSESSVTKLKDIFCPVCARKFKEARQLRHHLDSVHEKVKPHLCNFCGYSASSKSSLKLHLRFHTGEKPYACQDCPYRSSDHNSLRRHKMRHSGEKKYQCQLCSYSSIQSSTFKAHMKSKHPEDLNKAVFNCSKCMFKTLKEGNMQAHMSGHHLSKDV